MPYIGLKPGQRVTVTIHGYLDEVLINGVKVSYAHNEQVELFTETDDVAIAVDETPEQWPPLAGDIWRLFFDPEGSEDWHAVICRDYTGDASATEVQMTPPTQADADWRDPAELLAMGRLRLVWRNGMAVL